MPDPPTLGAMTTTSIAPLGPATWDDVQHIFAGGGDGPSCQCRWPMMRQVDFSRATQEELAQAFREELDHSPAPGLVLSIDAEPAGWVRVGPRTAQRRLAHTRGLPQASRHPLDDASVWAITCFSIPRVHRGQGIMARLLDAAVAFAREHGARVVEAYPRDPRRRATPSNDLFVGTVETFERAGFTRVAPLGSTKEVVELVL